MDGDYKKQNSKPINMVHDDSTILQSLWIRHCIILANNSNWKSLESELRFILCSGVILWTIHCVALVLL